MSKSKIKETIMDPKTVQYNVSFFSSPNISISRVLSHSVLFGLLVSYFLVTAGVIYDIIVEPPSVGSYTSFIRPNLISYETFSR